MVDRPDEFDAPYFFGPQPTTLNDRLLGAGALGLFAVGLTGVCWGLLALGELVLVVVAS